MVLSFWRYHQGPINQCSIDSGTHPRPHKHVTLEAESQTVFNDFGPSFWSKTSVPEHSNGPTEDQSSSGWSLTCCFYRCFRVTGWLVDFTSYFTPKVHCAAAWDINNLDQVPQSYSSIILFLSYCIETPISIFPFELALPCRITVWHTSTYYLYESPLYLFEIILSTLLVSLLHLTAERTWNGNVCLCKETGSQFSTYKLAFSKL